MNYKMVEQLGTYINDHDLNKILSKGVRTKNIVRSYFHNNKEERIKRAFSHIEDFTSKMLQNSSFPVKTIMKTEETTKNCIFRFLDEKKYYKKSRILIYQIAILDNLLTMKISINEFRSIKKTLGFEKHAQFSFWNLRQKQRDLKRGSLKERI